MTYCCNHRKPLILLSIYIKFLPINGLTDLAQICLGPRMTPRKDYKCKITKKFKSAKLFYCFVEEFEQQ